MRTVTKGKTVRLQTEQDVDSLLADLKTSLMQELAEGDVEFDDVRKVQPMNKAAIKNFAISARKSWLQWRWIKQVLGITKENIAAPSSRGGDFAVFPTHFGTETRLDSTQQPAPKLGAQDIGEKGYDFVMEEVAYTWFNRLIARRFMEVNDYLPTRVRVLSSETAGKAEPILSPCAQCRIGLPPPRWRRFILSRTMHAKAASCLKAVYQAVSLAKFCRSCLKNRRLHRVTLLTLRGTKRTAWCASYWRLTKPTLRQWKSSAGCISITTPSRNKNAFDGLKRTLKLQKKRSQPLRSCLRPMDCAVYGGKQLRSFW